VFESGSFENGLSKEPSSKEKTKAGEKESAAAHGAES